MEVICSGTPHIEETRLRRKARITSACNRIMLAFVNRLINMDLSEKCSH